jgi:hypothetical protein
MDTLYVGVNPGLAEPESDADARDNPTAASMRPGTEIKRNIGAPPLALWPTFSGGEGALSSVMSLRYPEIGMVAACQPPISVAR